MLISLGSYDAYRVLYGFRYGVHLRQGIVFRVKMVKG